MKKSKIFIIPALVGIVLFIYGIKSILTAIDSRNWSHCKGTIIMSKVDQSTRSSGSSKNRHTTTTYSPKVKYKYIYNDHEYLSSRITFGDRRGGRKTAQTTINYYSVGKEVDVYFNPENPAQSVLQPGYWSFGPLFPGVIFFGVSFFVYKSDRKKTEPVLLK